MQNKQKEIENYIKIIDEIEKVRTRNNVNWMDILRLAFTHAPDDAKNLMRKINTADDEISALLKKLLD
tara:strand:- start:731 stop:934 length:204 start_codon:yes stop_codon:yes gene_type:complete